MRAASMPENLTVTQKPRCRRLLFPVLSQSAVAVPRNRGELGAAVLVAAMQAMGAFRNHMRPPSPMPACTGCRPVSPVIRWSSGGGRRVYKLRRTGHASFWLRAMVNSPVRQYDAFSLKQLSPMGSLSTSGHTITVPLSCSATVEKWNWAPWLMGPLDAGYHGLCDPFVVPVSSGKVAVPIKVLMPQVFVQ